MALSQERLDAFEAVIESIGGRTIERACRPRVLQGIPAGTFVEGSNRACQQDIVDAYTCGCGNRTMVEVPDGESRKGEPSGDLIVCAVCDAATQMPRFTPEAPPEREMAEWV